MRIFAISDLHLSFSTDKPMNIFGEKWEKHEEKIKESWGKTVKNDDLVLLPGDHSWALKLEEAVPDLEFIGSLTGKKILLKGNHDYWWQSASKVKSVLPADTYILQNDSYVFGDYCICGTRGWIGPWEEDFTKEDEKIYERELLRLRMSLSSAEPGKKLIVMLHYPPFNKGGEKTPFIDIMEEYEVISCIYGHIHGPGLKNVFEGKIDNIDYHLVSADYLDFKPKEIY